MKEWQTVRTRKSVEIIRVQLPSNQTECSLVRNKVRNAESGFPASVNEYANNKDRRTEDPDRGNEWELGVQERRSGGRGVLVLCE